MILFDNCLIQAPDGTNLSRCGVKKIRWYLNQGLADLVGDDPPVIRLRFEPSGREGLNDPLLLEGKPNVCVVCGTDEDLTRHHIIPYCFVKHMKLEYKVDIIRDIFPLCRPCHNEYEFKSHEKKLQMSREYGVPIHGIQSTELRRVRLATGAAVALLEHRDKIPEDRRRELTQAVCDFLGKPSITDDDLKSLRKYRIKDRPDYMSFSKYVAESVENYSEFAKDWRTHFVETMKPRHMPPQWKVDRITDNVWVPKRMLECHKSSGK